MIVGKDHHQIRTLWLCGALHAFTHIYHVALMPLYLLIQRDLALASVESATLLLTLMMLAYFLPSYGMGVLADRFSRKKLLAAGLAINGLGYVGLAFAHTYAWTVACVMVAGLGGSFFHPAATAMVAGLFPLNRGRALGLIGVGASVGFFIGPLYSGWRADSAGWRAPVLELGAALVKEAQASDSAAVWTKFARKYRREMAEPENARLLSLLAALSQQTNFSVGCYCADEGHCHRSILRELLRERGAVIA